MSASVRLLVWPVGERLWLLHAVPPRAPAETVTLVSQLRDRASQWAMKQWQEVQQAETGMKSWVKKATNALMQWVSDEEVVMRAIPWDSRTCVVLHPPVADGSEVAAYLSALAKDRRQLHRKWFFLSWAALGVTVPLMIIPIIPAVPFYWNAYRIWGNRKSWLGAGALDYLLQSHAVASKRKPCTRTLACAPGECCRVAAAVSAAPEARSVVVPCDLLATPRADDNEASFARATADVERALDAAGFAAHAHERLLAAQKLRRKHGQL